MGNFVTEIFIFSSFSLKQYENYIIPSYISKRFRLKLSPNNLAKVIKRKMENIKIPISLHRVFGLKF